MNNTNFNYLPFLVVDDEVNVLASLKKVLEKEGYTVITARNGKEAMKMVTENQFSVIITDINMPEMNGFQLLHKIKNYDSQIEVIMITGQGTIEHAVEAIKAGAYDYITKPFKRTDILKVAEKAYEKFNLSNENRLLKKQLSELQYDRYTFIGQSKQAVKIRELISRIASTSSSVLITGESGTGKEVIARLIHANSSRKDKPFVAVNCGAIAENLVESELFGHVRGAFTGAIKDREGLFKAAGDGTLFLDEISTIPLNLQVKLLRVLEEMEIMPVGSTKTIPVNARIIAATNRNLTEEVKNNRFREDLFFRLNVIEINIPSLKDRKEDIPLMMTFFIDRFNKELKKNVKGFAPEVLHTLKNHNWAGNVRELENVIERAMIFCDNDLLQLEHLPQLLTERVHATSLTLKDALTDFEKEHIRMVLDMTNGDKKETARILDMGVSSLYRKMSELDI